PERWLDLRWYVEERTPQRFPARIVLQTVNEPGSLAQVAQVIAEHDGNIDNIGMERSSPDFTSLTIDLEVFDIKYLKSIIAQLREKDVVANAERVNALRRVCRRQFPIKPVAIADRSRAYDLTAKKCRLLSSGSASMSITLPP